MFDDIKVWIIMILAGVAAFGWYEVRGARLDLTEYKLSISNERAEQAASDNMDLVIRLRNNERISDAQKVRDAAIAKQLAGSKSALGRLQRELDALEARSRPDDPEARRYADEASAARGVFGRCAEKYRGVDERAKTLGSQVMGLQTYINEVCRPGASQKGAAAAAE